MNRNLWGVHTLEDLRARCEVDTDDEGACWHWRGATSHGRPSLWLPALQSAVTAATAIAVLVTGDKPPPGIVWHCTCSSSDCVNPAHRNPDGTRSTQMLALGMVRNPLQRARISAGRVATSRISIEKVEQILAATGTLAEISAEHGIALSYASRLRRGERRQAVTTPGASVFTWRPAA